MPENYKAVIREAFFFALKSILIGAILWILGKWISFDGINLNVTPKSGGKKDA